MTPPAPVLLVVDDEPAVVRLIERMVEGSGYRVLSHGGGQETIAHVAAIRPTVALVDLRMPHVDGLEFLKVLRAADSECQMVLMTAHATVESAMEAVKLGALDYLNKPLDRTRLRRLLTDVREELDRRSALLKAEQDTARRLEFCGMIGRSPLVQEVFRLVRRISPHARTTLVTGETGTGKELVARALHKLGPRSAKPFLTINCSAVVETLFESELFGHVRGAFTGATNHKAGFFEQADGGTLFLDEVGELPLTVQAKLLRVLEAGEVQRVGAVQAKKIDTRIVAATNRNLQEEAAAGRFRSDLLYRLNLVEICLPPLRDRREDIPYLTASFVAVFSRDFQKPFSGLTPPAEQQLNAYEWPGNVRELRNVIERACMLSDGPVLTERDIERAMPQQAGHSLANIQPRVVRTNVLKQAEMDQIHRTLTETRGNKAEAARRLGVSRRALYRRLEQRAPQVE